MTSLAVQLWRVALLSAVLILGGAEEASYRNYKVYDIQPTLQGQLEVLHKLHDDAEVDFWSTPNLHRAAQVMVSPKRDEQFRELLDAHNITHQLVNEDVQRAIDQERLDQLQHHRSRRDANQSRAFTATFDHFWTLEEINGYLDYLAAEYPKLVRLKHYGNTSEDRPLRVITISITGQVRSFRPVVLLDGGIHAREWGAHMSVLYLIHQLVERSQENMDLLENTDWVILPVANPDGYAYTHSTNRLWRKNRSRVNSLCQGVDLNRNFPFHWQYTSSTCTDGYAGPTPSSELETRAMMLLMAEYARATKVYLAVHTCGDLVLYPYGYDFVTVPNAAELQRLGDQAARAVRDVDGPTYQVGSASVLLYPANGSDDFIYGSYGVEYVYTLELSCAAEGNGFVLSVPEMQNVTREAFEMFKVFGKFAGEQTVAPLRSES